MWGKHIHQPDRESLLLYCWGFSGGWFVVCLFSTFDPLISLEQTWSPLAETWSISSSYYCSSSLLSHHALGSLKVSLCLLYLWYFLCLFLYLFPPVRDGTQASTALSSSPQHREAKVMLACWFVMNWEAINTTGKFQEDKSEHWINLDSRLFYFIQIWEGILFFHKKEKTEKTGMKLISSSE